MEPYQHWDRGEQLLDAAAEQTGDARTGTAALARAHFAAALAGAALIAARAWPDRSTYPAGVVWSPTPTSANQTLKRCDSVEPMHVPHPWGDGGRYWCRGNPQAVRP